MIHLATDEEIFELLQTLPGGSLGAKGPASMAWVATRLYVESGRHSAALLLHPFRYLSVNTYMFPRTGWVVPYTICVRAYLGTPDTHLFPTLAPYMRSLLNVDVAHIDAVLDARRLQNLGVDAPTDPRLDRLAEVVHKVASALARDAPPSTFFLPSE